MLHLVPVLAGLATSLFAQTIEAPDTFKVSYFSNANTTGFPDGMVRITNAGTQTGSPEHPLGNLCAMIYVLDPSQELDECCGCSLSPDSLRTLSLNINLTSNPLTPVTLTNGDIKIISSGGAPGCNPSQPTPTAGVRAWSTHIQDNGNITEAEFSNSSLSAKELSSLAGKCKAITSNGHGFGICWCGTLTGDPIANLLASPVHSSLSD